jgi:6-phospho-beta-glucosidase
MARIGKPGGTGRYGRGIAIVGGGVWAAKLVEGLARGLPAGEVELRLTARRLERLERIAAHAARRVETIRPDARIRACVSLAEAVEGAAIVILAIRVGGAAARAHDEGFPARANLVGDEGIGAGGMANAWRTVPVLEAASREIRRGAPGARVVNLVAPLGITTRLLLDEGIAAVGMCELPLVTREELLASAPPGCRLAYAGLNHLGWFWAVDEDGARALSAAVDAGRVDRQVLEVFGAAPLHYYYDVIDPASGCRLGRARRPGRAQELAAWDAEIFEELCRSPGADIPALERRPTPWFDRAVIPGTSAFLGGPPHEGFANVRNAELLPCVPPSGIVEVDAGLAERGVEVRSPGTLPTPVARFLRAAGESERLVYEAARERDPSRLREALEALPISMASREIPDLIRGITGGDERGGAAP